MCGIMGYYSFGEARPKKETLEELFVLLESRGSDASGWAYRDEINGRLNVYKTSLKSSQILQYKDVWQKTPITRSMIFHTRAATQGSKHFWYNNHPLYNAQYALVHNGIIWNYDDYKIPDSVVDSLAILHLVDKHKADLNQVFAGLEGSYACAMVQADNNNLTLFRHESPIEMYYDKKDDILYFASEKRMMDAALNIKPCTKRGLTLINQRFVYMPFADNSSLVIGETGVIAQGKHRPKPDRYSYYNKYGGWYDRDGTYHNYSSYYRSRYDDYDDDISFEKKKEKEEQKQLADGKIDTNDFKVITCPNCLERVILDLEEIAEEDNEDNICPKCSKVIPLSDIWAQM